MKKILVILLILIALVAGGLLWWLKNVEAPTKEKNYLDLVISKGSSATQIASKLESVGLIKSSLAFRIYVQITNQAEKIPSGEYRLPSNLSLFKLVDQLIKGPTGIWVTIPEGLRREEIAQEFASALGQNSQFTEEFLNLSKGQEGFLFPDTYLFLKDASPSAVINKMLATFDKRVDSKMKDDIKVSGRTLSEVINLASLVERETKTDEERPIVAGILFKRIEIGMPLQVDATVQYAIANDKCQMTNVKCESWWPTTTLEDRKINSKYNTYKYGGLPPTPIANPGLSSIKAAIYPQDSPYLYYLHDAGGQIHYAKTLDEQNANARKYIEE
jgi:UPF0755 protein